MNQMIKPVESEDVTFETWIRKGEFVPLLGFTFRVLFSNKGTGELRLVRVKNETPMEYRMITPVPLQNDDIISFLEGEPVEIKRKGVVIWKK